MRLATISCNRVLLSYSVQLREAVGRTWHVVDDWLDIIGSQHITLHVCAEVFGEPDVDIYLWLSDK